MWRGGFGRLFAADAISTSGTVISTLALQFVLIDTLHADQQAIGVVRAAQWAPYLVVGMLAGVLVDRVRRRPVLVVADLVSAAVFTAIGVLALTGGLTVPILAALVFVAGTVTCAGVAAYQSYVPRLVPDPLLPAAFARLEQMGQVVGSVGPLVSGSLVRFVTAPVAVLIDAVTYVASAVTLWTIRTPEPPPAPSAHRDLRAELREGAAWVYRHDVLRPYALWLHCWFFGISMVTTVVVYYATVELHLDPLAVGAAMAASGISGIVVAGFAPRLAARFGVGRVITTVEWSTPVWPVLVALAEPGPWAWVTLVVAHLIAGVTAITSSLMMSHRTAITPDRLRARMNATIRTFNWGGIAIAAPISGWIAATWGTRAAILCGAAVLLAATAYLWLSPYRDADFPHHDVS